MEGLGKFSRRSSRLYIGFLEMRGDVLSVFSLLQRALVSISDYEVLATASVRHFVFARSSRPWKVAELLLTSSSRT